MRYMNVYLKIFIVSCIILFCIRYVGFYYVDSFAKLILVSLLIALGVVLLYALFVFEKGDLVYVVKYCLKKITKL